MRYGLSIIRHGNDIWEFRSTETQERQRKLMPITKNASKTNYHHVANSMTEPEGQLGPGLDLPT